MIRVAILAGVSTDVQAADDKASIPDQLATCRDFIKANNAIETDHYVMDGYSRTGYDSLDEAMVDIPPLKHAIEAARDGKYDILLLDNWDRLGDLGQLVHTRFRWKYKKQLHSVRQSGKLQDPSEYDPNLDESGAIDMHIQGILQTYRIAKMRRGNALGTKKRVEDGKHSRGYSWGYRRNEAGELEPDPVIANLLIRIKDGLLSGMTTDQLADMANETGILSTRGGKWRKGRISMLLHNPFYAGKVFKDRWYASSSISRVTGKKYRLMKRNPDPELYDGAHPPLWSYEEFLRIKDELETRYLKMSHNNPKNFSGLLVCGVCGRPGEFMHGFYICRPPHEGRMKIDVNFADEWLGREIAEQLKQVTDDTQQEVKPDDTAKKIAAIDRRIAIVHNGMEDETYTATQGGARINAYKKERQRILDEQSNDAARVANRQRLLETRDMMGEQIDELPYLLATETPKGNNLMLRRIVREILITGDKAVVHFV